MKFRVFLFILLLGIAKTFANDLDFHAGEPDRAKF